MQRLGVTKGSFYWHFSDIQGYLDALAEAWARSSVQPGLAGGAARARARGRLASMMRQLTGPRQWILERAMREWARQDPRSRPGARLDRSIYRRSGGRSSTRLPREAG